MARRKPNVLILGAQKSGTTSLFNLLAKHPEISPSNIKEVHYFDDNLDKGELWYMRHFPYKWQKTQWTLEATPYYLFHPLVAERIAKELPGAKLILLLRNPVDRAYSHYQMAKHDGYEIRGSFEEAIMSELESMEIRNLPHGKFPSDNDERLKKFSYLERGKYAEQIIRYLKFFDRNQIFIIQSEILFNNPKTVIGSLSDFLGIEDVAVLNLPKSNGLRYEKMKSGTRNQLKQYFLPYNRQLSELLNEEFNWDDDKEHGIGD